MPAQTALMQAIALASAIPDIRWEHGDDLCDCTFQRIGSWSNPYIGKTLRVRMCCIWERIYEQYPEFVQRIDASWDGNAGVYQTEPQPWDSDEWDMPRALWHRQLSASTGASLADVRAEYAGQEPPKRLPSKNPAFKGGKSL